MARYIFKHIHLLACKMESLKFTKEIQLETMVPSIGLSLNVPQRDGKFVICALIMDNRVNILISWAYPGHLVLLLP